MLDKKYLRNVPLPKDLTNDNIFDALQDTQNFLKEIRQRTGVVLSTIIQANNFSGVVSNVFTAMLSDRSVYHSYSEQRYPDLMHEDGTIGLEVKAANKPWKGGEGHNGHTGWHIVCGFESLENGDIEFIHVEIAYLNGFELPNSDWKYQKSERNVNNSQRTETYITNEIGTAKLRDGSVYLNTEVVNITPQRQKARERVSLDIPSFSPFYD
jgi:hypothetical protein